ncbi:hypothetical protein A3193_18505 [Candidatus Thiodiazotropha endoloripes]|uniref:hypothetical protein n=1 Tax=Candidatus Thiodiazotropha endoloripes TaxID=1818881 RepID=UPI00083D6F82|nr:hypothetical protein [Candidatus Thiodiazotropha endoloripes]ODB82741.1 hypothetical protein A3193_18505 [Candidatus Thiodiazotropha endoloripes]
MATATIIKTSPADLREQLLFAIKDMSALLSMSTNVDYGNEKLLAPQFVSSLAQEIGELAEIAINIKETDEVES